MGRRRRKHREHRCVCTQDSARKTFLSGSIEANSLPGRSLSVGRFLLFRIGRSLSALLFDDLDHFRWTDLPIAAYPMAGNVIECCEQTLLDLRRGPDGVSSRVVPFFQFDFMALRRYAAKQLGRSFGARRSIAEGNRHLKRAMTVARRIFTTSTIDNDTALFQNHGLILTRSNCLPMPAQGRRSLPYPHEWRRCRW